MLKRLFMLICACLLVISMAGCGLIQKTEDIVLDKLTEPTQAPTELATEPTEAETTLPTEPETEPPTGPATQPPTEPPTKPAVVTAAAYTTAAVAGRDKPYDSAKTLRDLAAHTDVELVSKENGWCEVRLDGQTLYIPSDYVRKKQPSNGFVIAIDPGHQAKGNYEKEPVGPAHRKPRPRLPAARRVKHRALPSTS